MLSSLHNLDTEAQLGWSPMRKQHTARKWNTKKHKSKKLRPWPNKESKTDKWDESHSQLDNVNHKSGSVVSLRRINHSEFSSWLIREF